MTTTWNGSLTAAVSLVLLALSPARAAEQPGVLWETMSQTVMEGMPMPMPVQTRKLCAAKEWARPPAGGDPSCTNSSFKKVGSRATWTVQCTGEMEMTGVGEMTFNGTDSYTGSVKFTGDQMSMIVKLSGRKIGGCDNPQ